MCKILVCSSIMGSGKSSGCRSYILENPDRKYIYITPFLDEAEKLAKDCASLHFIQPGHYEEFGKSKVKHIEYLISTGANISSTHAAFAALSREALEEINRQKYTLICDETIDAVRVDSAQVMDLQILERAGVLEKSGDSYKFIGDDKYIDGKSKYSDLCKLARSNNIIFDQEVREDGSIGDYYYVLLPPEFLLSFECVIVLCYMFENSSLCALMKLYSIEYKYIGIERISYGNGYMLSENGMYIPEYVKDLKSKLHIYEYNKNPIIGRGRPPKNLNVYKTGVSKLDKGKPFKPSYSFFQKTKENKWLFDELKNNQRTFFDKMIKQYGGNRDLCMWSTYECAIKKIESKGLRKKWVAFNSRATNQYRDKKYLSYIVDPHIRPNLKRMYTQHGIEYDEKKWALSVAIQWIWRSAIRDGGAVFLYCPSKRLRNEINKWVNNVSNGVIYR